MSTVIKKQDIVEYHKQSILNLLHDEGPTKLVGIAEHIKLSPCRVSKLLSDMRHEGLVEHIRIGNRTMPKSEHWILAEDLESA